MPRPCDPELNKASIDLMHFLAEKSRNVENPMNVREICREFKEFSGSTFSYESLKQKFYRDRMKIHKMDDFDIDTKVKMMFATSTQVNFNFLNKLEKQATVEVDEENRISNYIANDGILKLKGDHIRSSKTKLVHVERRECQINQQLLSNDFNGEEEESDVEYEDADGEGENLKDEFKEPISRSGRVPKRRFTNSDCSNDTDDGVHESSTKKKTEKDTKSIDSTPTTSSVPSSSARRTPRIQRTEQSNEVIYDSSGEPSLQVPLKIKQETIQNHVDDDVEFENTQISENNQINEEVKMEVEDQKVVESTNSDEFLKLLQNIVKTLSSELLAELERDIETEMETFRNENRKIQIKDIEMALRATIDVVVKAAKPNGKSSENTTSLKGFLMLLNMIALNNSSLTVIQQEIQEAIKGLGVEDKIIHFKSIRLVLGCMLLFVTS